MNTASYRLFEKACSEWDRGNLESAFELFSQAAVAGDESCQLNLGYFYDYGLHVTQDKKLARYWYHQAYLQGAAHAASNIATIYRDDHDYRRMVWWFRAAVRMGDGDALLEIARCYESGCGVSRDRKRALEYYLQLLDSPNTTESSRETAKERIRLLQVPESRSRRSP